MSRSGRILAGLFLISVLGYAQSSWLLRPADVMIRDLVGTASVAVEGGRKTALVLEAKLRSGSFLSSGRRSRVDLGFSNGASVRLGSETELRIDEYLQSPVSGTGLKRDSTMEPSTSKMEMSLHQGEITVTLKTLDAERGSSFVLETIAGNVRAKAGVFAIRLERSEKGYALLTIRSEKGDLSFEPEGGPPVQLQAGAERKFSIEPVDGKRAFRVKIFDSTR